MFRVEEKTLKLIEKKMGRVESLAVEIMLGNVVRKSTIKAQQGIYMILLDVIKTMFQSVSNAYGF